MQVSARVAFCKLCLFCFSGCPGSNKKAAARCEDDNIALDVTDNAQIGVLVACVGEDACEDARLTMGAGKVVPVAAVCCGEDMPLHRLHVDGPPRGAVHGFRRMQRGDLLLRDLN